MIHVSRRTLIQLLAVGFSRANERPTWTSVADRIIGTPVESYPFNWGEGVQMMGLMRAARVSHNSRYTDYVERWALIYETMNANTATRAGWTPDVGAPSTEPNYGHVHPWSVS